MIDNLTQLHIGPTLARSRIFMLVTDDFLISKFYLILIFWSTKPANHQTYMHGHMHNHVVTTVIHRAIWTNTRQTNGIYVEQ